jgi:lactoylglutathione lyase
VKILHTMIRVKNLEESIKFYKEIFGLTLNSLKEYESGKFTLAFLGYGPIETHPQIELTYNWGVDNYEIGTAFGHIAFSVENAYDFCEKAKLKGANVVREAGPMKGGTTVLAFIEDPNGYKLELIEKK